MSPSLKPAAIAGALSGSPLELTVGITVSVAARLPAMPGPNIGVATASPINGAENRDDGDQRRRLANRTAGGGAPAVE